MKMKLICYGIKLQVLGCVIEGLHWIMNQETKKLLLTSPILLKQSNVLSHITLEWMKIEKKYLITYECLRVYQKAMKEVGNLSGVFY